MDFKDTILLTGAGFTANFGGFLAKEMWSKIFNNPKLADAGILKLELKKSFDFEELYSRVLDNRIPNLQPHEYNIFVEALNEAYLSLDQVIRSPSWEFHGIHPSELNKFLEYFSKDVNGKTGICFTLNQDLFMERHVGWQPLGPTSMRYKGNFGALDVQDLNSDQLKILPNQSELDSYISSVSENFCFVKLHGSQKWIAPDGMDTKVLGINKREAIERIPLLKWYFALFEQALFRKNVRLVVIGYSFNDVHINECIVKAINEYGLKLYIISTEEADKFSFRMRFKYSAGTAINDQDDKRLPIWNAVDGYFAYELRRIFPYSQSYSAERADLFKSLGIAII